MRLPYLGERWANQFCQRMSMLDGLRRSSNTSSVFFILETKSADCFGAFDKTISLLLVWESLNRP